MGKDNQVSTDGNFGSGTFEKLQLIAKDKKQSKEFLNNLRTNRDEYVRNTKTESGDLKRNEHFGFKELYSFD